MSEKRILIIEVSGCCRNIRPVGNETYCARNPHCAEWEKIDENKDCPNCQSGHYQGITRTEAVERMAKAMCQHSTGVQWDIATTLTKSEYEDLAEVAIDSLLEKIKCQAV